MFAGYILEGLENRRKVRGGFLRPRKHYSLLLVNEMPPAILLPAAFVGFHAERLFLAITDGLDAIGAHTGCDQCVLHRRSPLIPQSQIEFRGPPLVAVPLNREGYARVLIEELRIGLDRTLLRAADIGLVVIEVDILYRLPEKILFCSRWRRRSLSLRRRYREARSGLLSSTRTFGDEVIGSGVAGADLLRSAGLNCADAVNGNVGGARGLPA